MQICLGFDGSSTDDWTAIRAETVAGFQFTPTFGGNPTIWNPADSGGRIPRGLVNDAVVDVFARYDVARMYCDPRDWQSEIDAWAQLHGEDRVLSWFTTRIGPMHLALERFAVDLAEGAITHDGCPITAQHMANCRRVPKPGEKYILGKPEGAYHQKIDAAMASVLAHQAACDARAKGWGQAQQAAYVYVS